MLIASYLAIILRRWWIILGIPLLLGGVAYLNSDSGEPEYEATSSLLLRNMAPLLEEETPPESAVPPEGEDAEAGAAEEVAEPEGPRSLNEFLTSERIVATYANLVYRRDVLERVAANLSLPYDVETLRGKIQASPVGNTLLIAVTVTDSNPELAAAIANDVAASFVAMIEGEIGVAGTVLVAEQAAPPSTPLSVTTNTAVILALSAGLLLAALAVFVLEHMDDTVRTPEEAEAIASLPVLGVIGRSRRAGRSHPGDTPIAEDYRDLRASLRAIKDRTGLQTVLVAGHGRREGRSVTAYNLGLMLAEAGESVVVVDADLRQPSLHRIARTGNERGLSTLLGESERRVNLPTVLVNSNLELITAGPPVKNPSAVASVKMAELLDELVIGTDFVILDSPALSGVSDASDLARIADGTVLVIQAGRTQARALRASVAMLEQRGAQLLGLVVNKGKSPRRQGKSYRAHLEQGRGGQKAVIPLAVKERPRTVAQETEAAIAAASNGVGPPAPARSANHKEGSSRESRRVTPYSRVRQRMDGTVFGSHVRSNGARMETEPRADNNSKRTG